MIRPKISQISSKQAPPKATTGSVRDRFSPYFRATRFGITSPTKGMAPMVMTEAATVTETSISPKAAVAA